MAKRADRAATSTGLVPVLRALVQLSAVDLLYADEYLRRAETLLPQLCTREQFLALQRDQENVLHSKKELRLAAEREDWAQVRTLAERAAQGRERVAAGEELLKIADAVYGPRMMHTDPAALAFGGLLVSPDPNLGKARAATLDQLRLLTVQDGERASFYRSRLAQLERQHIASEERAAPSLDRVELRRRIIEAAEKGDFAQVQRLTRTALNGNEPHSHPRDLPAVHPADRVTADLTAVLPATVVKQAPALGLAEVTLPADGRLSRYMIGDLAENVWPASASSETSSRRGAGSAPCGPEVRPSLRENLDLLRRLPFVSSAGTRYLPRFAAENLLVEAFAEDDPLANRELLKALGLQQRRGLSRLTIEHAIGTQGAKVCSQLGLDPAEFTLVCIPFDVYMRLAADYGWGREHLWTHFDGYQVTPQFRLRALVGGDARYGGPDDLCSVERDYDTDRLTVRFAIVRRQRFVSG